MTGIGIDTGGTCTDAVVYDLENKEVLASAKTQTTKEDLKKGITAALHALPEAHLVQCTEVALSTTLATNACVEGKGGHGKLILFGVSEKVFNETYASYGIADPSDVWRVDCRLSASGEDDVPPDWETFRAELPAFLADCDCVSVVQMYSAEYLGAIEEQAAAIIRACADIPVIKGHDLFPDRNAIRRGAGALLNARLIPVLQAFLSAVKAVFKEKKLDVPMTIIRSDGSQMSEAFAAARPVETLLCGPAASVIGAHALSETEDALIVDMGGTTTDIAIIRDGLPMRAGSGIQVGEWKTFVKGLFIDTFGLGGDTAVHYDRNGDAYLENGRVIPLCSLASAHPRVRDELEKLDNMERFHPLPLHEFFVAAGEMRDRSRYTEEECIFYDALRSDGPLSMEEAARLLNKEIYNLHPDRLLSEGLILKAGLTPTDFMHLRGDYNVFDAKASEYAARFFCRSSRFERVEELGDAVYELVIQKLYRNIARVLLQTGSEAFAKPEVVPFLEELIEWNHRLAAEEREPFFAPVFKTRAKLIGVGAPTHIFLPETARRLGMECVIPEHAAVANAIGAIAGQVVAIMTVNIQPFSNEEGDFFRVLGGSFDAIFDTREEAADAVGRYAAEAAEQLARAQGARGAVSVTKHWESQEAKMENGTMWLGDTLTVTATGKPRLVRRH